MRQRLPTLEPELVPNDVQALAGLLLALAGEPGVVEVLPKLAVLVEVDYN